MAGRAVPMRVGGVDLLVETTPVPGTEQTSAIDKAQDAVVDAFERGQSAIVAVATSTVGTINRLGERLVRPDEMKVKFGLKFSVQGNVIVAGAAGEATLEVELTYRREADLGAAGADQEAAAPGEQVGELAGSPAVEPAGSAAGAAHGS